MDLVETIKTIKNTQEVVYKNMCDKLNGDCNFCPFKGNCVAESLANIQLSIENAVLELKGVIKK